MFQVALQHCTRQTGFVQDLLGQLAAIFASLDDSTLLARLQEYRPTGRQGYPLKALWRAYVGSFVLNLPHTNALIRRLEDDDGFRLLCGFGTLPHRTTFNRFILRLSRHPDLVELCFAQLTGQIKALLPDLGEETAVDATTVRSHCAPNRTRISDPQASWTAKNSTQARSGGKEWRHGYKVHMIADVNYGLPLAHIVTTASRNDSPELPTVFAKTESLYPWFHPSAVIADRGYDSAANHEFLRGKDALPIIHIRRKARGELYEGIYTKKGVPTCLGQIPMEFVRSDPERGHLYRCNPKGCRLAGSMRGGIRHCDTEVWEDPTRNVRLFGAIRRDGPEWKALYAKRQAIERVFKSMKESRRLERHCVRGLRQITLHTIMSALAFQATALVKLRTGQADMMRWMVRKVA